MTALFEWVVTNLSSVQKISGCFACTSAPYHMVMSMQFNLGLCVCTITGKKHIVVGSLPLGPVSLTGQEEVIEILVESVIHFCWTAN